MTNTIRTTLCNMLWSFLYCMSSLRNKLGNILSNLPTLLNSMLLGKLGFMVLWIDVGKKF